MDCPLNMSSRARLDMIILWKNFFWKILLKNLKMVLNLPLALCLWSWVHSIGINPGGVSLNTWKRKKSLFSLNFRDIQKTFKLPGRRLWMTSFLYSQDIDSTHIEVSIIKNRDFWRANVDWSNHNCTRKNDAKYNFGVEFNM